MTTTPLATIADALIDFIMSLLHDPAAAADYKEDPAASLSNAGLGSACLADVRQVAPVIYEQPTVVYRPSPTPPPHDASPVEKAIWNVVNNYAVDNRSTMVDQSVNQNIWTHGGNVTQSFDQKSLVNQGDENALTTGSGDANANHTSIDAGHDANIGNTTTSTDVDVTSNQSSTDDHSTTIDGSFNPDESTTTHVDADDSLVLVDASHSDAATTDVGTDHDSGSVGVDASLTEPTTDDSSHDFAAVDYDDDPSALHDQP